MQFVSIDRQNNMAHIWFRGQDLADYLFVHRHTVYNHAKRSQFFHLNGHDIYKFDYDLHNISKTKFEKFPETVVFKVANKLKNENIQVVAKKVFNDIAISFLSSTFLNDDQKKKIALDNLKKLKDLKDVINPCFLREIEIIEIIKTKIIEYYEQI